MIGQNRLIHTAKILCLHKGETAFKIYRVAKQLMPTISQLRTNTFIHKWLAAGRLNDSSLRNINGMLATVVD